jgi:hypothetical protein
VSANFDRQDTRKANWVLEADYPPGLNRTAVGAQEYPLLRHWFQVLDALENEFKRGATEVRIRPVKP